MAQTMTEYLMEQGEKRGETQAKVKQFSNCCDFDSIPFLNPLPAGLASIRSLSRFEAFS